VTTIETSLLVVACVFSGSLVGLTLHRLLPAQHMTSETLDVVRLGNGLLSVLASLVLGLLIATAKSSYDSTTHAIRDYAAELGVLNETLRDYGGPASVPRDVLRRYTERFLADGWPPDGVRPATLEAGEGQRLLEQVREAIRALKPADAGATWLQDQALTGTTNLLRQRWLLIDNKQSNVQGVVLGVLVSWITVIFAGFGLNAPRNTTVVAAFFICALGIGGAIFLIMEMDRPLDGVMRISSLPVENVLKDMNW
jgi:hypothetical protein